MRTDIWKSVVGCLLLVICLGCGSGGRQHLNHHRDDVGMPDSPAYSDSPRPGQPDGYTPSGGRQADSAQAAVDSATMERYQ